MNIPLFNQNLKNDITNAGECIRLSNELRSKTGYSYDFKVGNQVKTFFVSPVNGFDIETCPLSDITNWIENKSIKKSKSLEAFVYRVLSVRFKRELANHKKIPNQDKEEIRLIKLASKNDVNWFGEVGFFDKVRLDKSIKLDKKVKDIIP